MLCNYAIRNFEKFGTRVDPQTKELVPRGLLVNYDALPGYVPRILLPHFGIDPLPPSWLAKITEESNYYSKGRGSKARAFTGDSADKDSRATDAIQEYAEKILAPTYATLEQLGRKSVPPSALATVLRENSLPVDADFSWKLLSVIPAVDEAVRTATTGNQAAGVNTGSAGGAGPVERSVAGQGTGSDTLPTMLRGAGHSTVLKEKEFLPWAPFANHHHSRPVQVIHE